MYVSVSSWVLQNGTAPCACAVLSLLGTQMETSLDQITPGPCFQSFSDHGSLKQASWTQAFSS